MVQCQFVPDRCVPVRNFFDIASFGQRVPWILCPWKNHPLNGCDWLYDWLASTLIEGPGIHPAHPYCWRWKGIHPAHPYCCQWKGHPLHVQNEEEVESVLSIDGWWWWCFSWCTVWCWKSDVNAGMPECRRKVSPASAFRYQGQSCTAGHG
jgi:hypothetical protein